MSIIRLIHSRIESSESENAVRVWKAECAPLMIQQKGCVSWRKTTSTGRSSQCSLS